jgi:peptidoglycan/LPS O-acetylase OafA/YrhL
MSNTNVAAKQKYADTQQSFATNNFDLIRLFAAFQVMLFHCAYHFDLAVPFPVSLLASFPGVPIFFVTSGFLIAASYDRSKSLLGFCKNRFLRMFPALWACIVLTSIVLLASGYQLVSIAGLTWFVSQMVGLIYTPGFLKEFGFGSYNGSLWTIPLELQFYTTVPFLHHLFGHRRNGRVILVLLLVAFLALGLGVRIAFPSVLGYSSNESLPAKLVRYSFLPNYFLFLTGMIAYKFRLETHHMVAKRALPWIIAVIGFGYISDLSAWSAMLGSMLIGGCALACAYTPLPCRNILRGNDLSYGIYIYHGLLINLALSMNLHRQWTSVVLVMVGAVAMAFVSWRLIERPSLALKRALA